MKKTILILGLMLLAPSAYAQVHATTPYDYCSNLEGMQTKAPAGWHAESDGTCKELPPPVTIDLVPEGGEAMTTDIAADGEDPVTIDVNPPAPSPDPEAEALPNQEAEIVIPGVDAQRVIRSIEEFRAASKPTVQAVPLPDNPAVIKITPKETASTTIPEDGIIRIQVSPDDVISDIENPSDLPYTVEVVEEPTVLETIGSFIADVWDGFISWFK
jgi:hypothetical protein